MWKSLKVITEYSATPFVRPPLLQSKSGLSRSESETMCSDFINNHVQFLSAFIIQYIK